jgi:hypothetical protein
VAVIYGLVLVLLVYWLSNELGLYSLNWLLTNFLGSIVLIVIILFQGDLRRALAQMGAGRFWKKAQLSDAIVDELAQAVMSLAKAKVGALIVIERYEPLGDVAERGVPLDAIITASTLVHNLSGGHPPARWRGDHPQRAHRRRRLHPAPVLQAQGPEPFRHAPPRGAGHQRGVRLPGHRRFRGARHGVRGPERTAHHLPHDQRLRRVIKNALER